MNVNDFLNCFDFCELYPHFNLTLYHTSNVTETEKEKVEEIVMAWYTLAENSSFSDGIVHNLRIIFDKEDPSIFLELDMGSCDLETIKYLVRAISYYMSSISKEITQVEINE